MIAHHGLRDLMAQVVGVRLGLQPSCQDEVAKSKKDMVRLDIQSFLPVNSPQTWPQDTDAPRLRLGLQASQMLFIETSRQVWPQEPQMIPDRRS